MTDGESQLLAVRLEASLAKFEKQLKRGYDVAKKMSTDTEARFSTMERKTQKSAQASGAIIEREMVKRRKGYDALMASMDPAYAATLRFQAGEKKLADALKYGEITSKEHARAMRLLKAQYDSVKTSAVATGAAISRTNGISRQGRGMIQNTSYQVADMAVQFEMGTDPMRIMGQQLPQLLAGFGAFGAVAGTVAAILFPLAGMFLNTGDEAEEAGDKVKTFADAMDVAMSAISDAGATADLIGDLESLEKMYGNVTDEVLDLVRALAQLAEQKAITETSSALEKFFSENPFLDSLREAMTGRDEIISDLEREMSAVQSQIDAGINVTYNREFLAELQAELQSIRGLEDIELDFGIKAGSAQRVVDLFNQAMGAVESGDISSLLVAVDELREELGGVANEGAAKLANNLAPAESLLRQAEANAKRLNDRLNESGDTTAVSTLRMSDLVEKYDRDTQKLAELASERASILSGRDVARSSGDAAAEAQADRMLRAVDEEIEKLSDATDRVEAMQSQIEKLQELMGYLKVDDSGQLRDTLQEMQSRLEAARLEGNNLSQLHLGRLEGQFDGVINGATRLLQKLGLIKDDLEDLRLPDAGSFEAEYVARAAGGGGAQNEELVRAVLQVSDRLGIAAKDLLTAMSYETGGTFDPWKAGPTTQWGQHRGLIQWGEPQRARYGVSESSTVTEQVLAAGRYLQDSGVKAGDGLLRIYAAINAGNADKIHASDAGNGGAPGTVLDKVNDQMAGHRERAEGLLSAYSGVSEQFRQTLADEKTAEAERQRELERAIKLRERELDLRRDLVSAAQKQLSDAEFEASLIGKSAAEQARLRAEYMLTQDAKRRGIDLNEKLAGQEQTYAELIREQADAIGQVVAAKEQQEAQNERLAEQERELAGLGDSIKDSLLDAILAGEDFADVLANVAKMLARAALEAALFNTGPFASDGGGGGLLGGIFGAIFGSAKGNVFTGGHHVAAFAKGGVVNGPTLFPMHGSKTGLMGEAGPEAIMPLTRTAGGKLGVVANGSSGGANVTFAPVIDARGADAGAVARMEAALQRAQAEFTPNVIKTVRDAQKKRHL